MDNQASHTIILHNYLKKSTTGHRIYVLNGKIMIGTKTEKLLLYCPFTEFNFFFRKIIYEEFKYRLSYLIGYYLIT